MTWHAKIVGVNMLFIGLYYATFVHEVVVSFLVYCMNINCYVAEQVTKCYLKVCLTTVTFALNIATMGGRK